MIAGRTAQPEARAALAPALGEAAPPVSSAATAVAELTGAADQFVALDLPVAAVVEMHVQNSMTKLGCRTRAEAVRRLAELGLTAAGGTVRA